MTVTYSLPALGPALASHTPESFRIYVDSLYKERVKKTAARKVRVRGRKLTNQTKKKPATYEFEFEAKKLTVALEGSKQVPLTLQQLSESLGCSIELIETFIKIKKFIVKPETTR